MPAAGIKDGYFSPFDGRDDSGGEDAGSLPFFPGLILLEQFEDFVVGVIIEDHVAIGRLTLEFSAG